MRRPELFDVFTLGVFWWMDKRVEDELAHQHNAEKALELKEREVKALEKLVNKRSGVHASVFLDHGHDDPLPGQDAVSTGPGDSQSLK